MERDEILFTKEHSWARIEDENRVAIGISHYAVEELGEITYVELPEIGQKVQQMEVIGSVESLRGTMEIYSPVTGEVVEINEMLIDDPTILNEDPYGDGWIAIIEMEDPDELARLMSQEDYESYIEAEREFEKEQLREWEEETF